ncbi:8198_t:CDS:1, partial [Racocetra persica]
SSIPMAVNPPSMCPHSLRASVARSSPVGTSPLVRERVPSPDSPWALI